MTTTSTTKAAEGLRALADLLDDHGTPTPFGVVDVTVYMDTSLAVHAAAAVMGGPVTVETSKSGSVHTRIAPALPGLDLRVVHVALPQERITRAEVTS